VTLLRLFLLAAGTVSVVAGLAFMVQPVETVALVELTPSTPTAVIEIQGFYGGQILGLGIATLLGAWRARFALPALVLLTASLGGTALGRVFGIVTTGSCPPVMAALFVIEAATASVAAFLATRAVR
jgi:hypothetical protein